MVQRVLRAVKRPPQLSRLRRLGGEAAQTGAEREQDDPRAEENSDCEPDRCHGIADDDAPIGRNRRVGCKNRCMATDPRDPIRRRVVVTGHVQGVFFRASVKEAAENETVAGSAENRADGAVEVVLEGPAEAVESVIGYCRVGPVNARVDSARVCAVAVFTRLQAMGR